MNKFSSRSFDKLHTAHESLIYLANIVLQKMDISITSGHRGESEQNALVPKFSKLKFPLSAHNKVPSMAIDVVPYPLDWEDLERFSDMRRLFYEAAEKTGITLKPIIKFSDGTFDYPHIELGSKAYAA